MASLASPIQSRIVIQISSYSPIAQAVDLSRNSDLTDNGITALTRHCGQLSELDVSACCQLSDASLYSLAAGCRELQAR